MWQNPEELRAFFLAIPKDGDIHNHLTGAVYAEDLIDQASAKDLCINLDNMRSSRGDYSQLVAECSRCSSGSKDLNAECKAFLDSNEKARIEWKLEEDLVSFEKNYAIGKTKAEFLNLNAANLNSSLNKIN
ncbi:MAG: hypothetical protein WA137_07715 [Methanothrix sp.]